MTTTNNPSIIAGKCNIMLPESKEWETAIEAVDYPVYLKPLFFKHEDENGDIIEVDAEGGTNTGRDSKFFGVVVDRNKTGDLSTIACVTDTYGTVPPKDVYSSLQSELEESEVNAVPSSLYVSGSGGMQVLTVRVDDQIAPNCQDKIGMGLHLITSLDGSKRHTIRLVAHVLRDDKKDVPLVGIGYESFNIAARHTKTIKDRHFAFETVLTRLIKEWNDTIMPTMAIMMDAKFNREMALDLLKNIMEDAKIPERHIKKASSYYEEKEIEKTAYGVLSGMSQYISEELEDKPERAEQFREAINKKAQLRLNEALKKIGVTF